MERRKRTRPRHDTKGPNRRAPGTNQGPASRHHHGMRRQSSLLQAAAGTVGSNTNQTRPAASAATSTNARFNNMDNSYISIFTMRRIIKTPAVSSARTTANTAHPCGVCQSSAMDSGSSRSSTSARNSGKEPTIQACRRPCAVKALILARNCKRARKVSAMPSEPRPDCHRSGWRPAAPPPTAPSPRTHQTELLCQGAAGLLHNMAQGRRHTDTGA
ncbi:hypothetical protein PSTG_18345 [Puccinia striiformis f. sp. tritici PST-78]|uniref:Uncharacterized protein n=1 Tax=Puccinia striiformis f. sp. tritici PST-78 TaxID=1165861 RepID=A0A0L0UNB2_9BASI|nr:hypothetical protein PSTG_18345 [Puccinia striiformis f. sp. tritici PST-78]